MAKVKTEVSVEPVLETKADPLETPAQLYKKAQIKALAEKRDAKFAEVLDKVKEMQDTKTLGIRGRWIVYTEKNGVNSPAIIVSEKFKDADGSLTIGAFVFSPNAAQPYRVEITF